MNAVNFMANYFYLNERERKIVLRITDIDTGVVLRETYKFGRLRHRDPTSGPADVWRDPETGDIVQQHYVRHGKLHRLDGPAEWACSTAGISTVEVYWLRGRMHRNPTEGPAEIRRDGKTGVPYIEAYYVDGNLCRDPTDGPSYIERDPRTGIVRLAIITLTKHS